MRGKYIHGGIASPSLHYRHPNGLQAMPLKPGLYEQVVTEALRQSLSEVDPALVKAEHLDEGESHDVLAEHRRQIVGLLLTLSGRLREPHRRQTDQFRVAATAPDARQTAQEDGENGGGLE